MQQGAPIQPNTGGTLNAGFGNLNNQRYLGTTSVTLVPKLTCDPRSGLSGGKYFNPACFAPPSGGSNGDVIWPYIHGPAYFNSDLAIYKDFAFREHHKVQFRFSAFNFLNHPLPQFGASGNSDLNLNFDAGGGALSQTNTNTNTSGKPLFTTGRRVVEFAIKYNF